MSRTQNDIDEQHSQNMSTSVKAHPFVLHHATVMVVVQKGKDIEEIVVYETDSWNEDVDQKDYEGIDFEIVTEDGETFEFGNRTRSRFSSGFFTDFSLRAQWGDKFKNGFKAEEDNLYLSEVAKVIDEDVDKTPDFQVMTRLDEDNKPNSLFIIDIDKLGSELRHDNIEPVKPTVTTPAPSQGIMADCAFYFSLEDIDNNDALSYVSSYTKSGNIYKTEPTKEEQKNDKPTDSKIKNSVQWYDNNDMIKYSVAGEVKDSMVDKISEQAKDILF